MAPSKVTPLHPVISGPERGFLEGSDRDGKVYQIFVHDHIRPIFGIEVDEEHVWGELPDGREHKKSQRGSEEQKRITICLLHTGPNKGFFEDAGGNIYAIVIDGKRQRVGCVTLGSGTQVYGKREPDDDSESDNDSIGSNVEGEENADVSGTDLRSTIMKETVNADESEDEDGEATSTPLWPLKSVAALLCGRLKGLARSEIAALVNAYRLPETAEKSLGACMAKYYRLADTRGGRGDPDAVFKKFIVEQKQKKKIHEIKEVVVALLPDFDFDNDNDKDGEPTPDPTVGRAAGGAGKA